MKSLKGKVALITGANSGIGLATAKVFADYGAKLVITGTRQEKTEEAALNLRKAGAEAIASRLDLSDDDSIHNTIQAAIDTYGRIDILVNNAADLRMTRQDHDIEFTDIEVWDRLLRSNVRGTMLCCKLALPYMVKQGAGAIVCIASALGVNSAPSQSAYAATKAAIISMTRSIATSHGKKGIRANAVLPGMTRTEGAVDNLPPFFFEMQLAENLTPYIGEPEDIANVVAFLASDEARYVTGQALLADGGSNVHVAGFARMNEEMARLCEKSN